MNRNSLVDRVVKFSFLENRVVIIPPLDTGENCVVSIIGNVVSVRKI